MAKRWMIVWVVVLGALGVLGCQRGPMKKPQLSQFRDSYAQITVGMDENEMVKTIGMSAMPAGQKPGEWTFQLQQKDGNVYRAIFKTEGGKVTDKQWVETTIADLAKEADTYKPPK